jgi:Transglycosylase-like domain
VRIRIALTAAMAVITGLTTGIFTATHHQSASAHGARNRSTSTASLPNTALAGFAIPHSVPVVAPKPAATTPVTPVTTPPVTPVTTPAVTPVTTPPVTTVTTPPPPVPVSDANSVNTADWACIRVHESGDQYNNPSDPSGAYGILISTWRSFGYSGWPYEAAPSVQDALALKLYSLDGFHPWSSRYACGI